MTVSLRRYAASLAQEAHRLEKQVQTLVDNQPAEKDEFAVADGLRIAAEKIVAIGIPNHHRRSAPRSVSRSARLTAILRALRTTYCLNRSRQPIVPSTRVIQVWWATTQGRGRRSSGQAVRSEMLL